jgi:AraC-like DNA-binding protein
MQPADLAISIRSYGDVRSTDRHDYAQLVLPLQGAVMLDIEGREARLDPLRAAFVEPGAWHSQRGTPDNRSLILDIAAPALPAPLRDQLGGRPFRPLNAASGKLVEFMGLMLEQQALVATALPAQPSAQLSSQLPPQLSTARPSQLATPLPAPLPAAALGAWLGLLIDSLTLPSPQPRSRLAAVLAAVAADPGQPWSTERMADKAGLSVSRLHALFREEHGSTPHGWLLRTRIECACALLARSSLPIADIACRAGFADQSALTRAMRNSTGQTPASYRRQAQENLPNT